MQGVICLLERGVAQVSQNRKSIKDKTYKAKRFTVFFSRIYIFVDPIAFDENVSYWELLLDLCTYFHYS